MRARVHADCRRSSRKERGKSFRKPDCYRQSRTGLAALNDRRFCLSDSWLQRGNICLKTCTSFTAGFMPEIEGTCVNKLAAGAPMAGCCGPCSKKNIQISIRCEFWAYAAVNNIPCLPWLFCARQALQNWRGHPVFFALGRDVGGASVREAGAQEWKWGIRKNCAF